MSTTAGGPRGAVHEITAGPYTALVTEVGATLEALTHEGRDLIVRSGLEGPMLFYRGAIVAPWPNRIGDGDYAWDGERIQAALNEPERGNALHGLLSFQRYETVGLDPDAVTLAAELFPSTAYPFHLRVEVAYRLDAERGLITEVHARNLGQRDLPYGVCPHPYLVAGPAPLDTWTIEVAATTVLQVDDRLLPVGAMSVEPGSAYDLSASPVIGERTIDHAFTDLARTDGIATVTLRDPSGTGVAIDFDERCPWLQLHSGDRPEPEHDRLGMAVEPMTCPPDAFRSGTDVVRLAPGAEHDAGWRICAL